MQKNCRTDITINILELNYFARESISLSFNHINISKSVDTYLVITNNNSLYAVTQPQHISIQIQLYTQYIQYIHDTNNAGIYCTTHSTKTRQQCTLPPWDHSPGCWQPPRTSLSRTTANERAVLRSPCDSSANHGRHTTDHPSSSAKTHRHAIGLSHARPNSGISGDLLCENEAKPVVI